MEAYGDDAAWEELEQAFFDSFLGIQPYKAVDGVAIVRRSPLVMKIKPDTTDWYEPHGSGELFASVVVEVYEGDVEPSEVCDLYRELLQRYSLSYVAGRMDFSTHSDEDSLRIVVRPEEDPDLHPVLRYGGGVMHSPEGAPLKPQPAFPDPEDVAAFFGMLKEKRHTPKKQEGGPPFIPYNGIPTVVAGYLSGHENLPRGRKGKVTRLVRAHLLEPRYPRIPCKQKSDLWRDLDSLLPYIRRVERAFTGRLGLLRKYF